MKTSKFNLSFVIGLLVFSLANIINHSIGMSDAIYGFLTGMAVSLEIVGFFCMIFVHKLGISKFRKSKVDFMKNITRGE